VGRVGQAITEGRSNGPSVAPLRVPRPGAGAPLLGRRGRPAAGRCPSRLDRRHHPGQRQERGCFRPTPRARPGAGQPAVSRQRIGGGLRVRRHQPRARRPQRRGRRVSSRTGSVARSIGSVSGPTSPRRTGRAPPLRCRTTGGSWPLCRPPTTSSPATPTTPATCSSTTVRPPPSPGSAWPPTGTQANGDSRSPSMERDGTVVAFTSSATNLVAGDGNGKTDVFVRTLGSSPSTTLVSVRHRRFGPRQRRQRRAQREPRRHPDRLLVRCHQPGGHPTPTRRGDVFRRGLGPGGTTELVSLKNGPGFCPGQRRQLQPRPSRGDGNADRLRLRRLQPDGVRRQRRHRRVPAHAPVVVHHAREPELRRRGGRPPELHPPTSPAIPPAGRPESAS